MLAGVRSATGKTEVWKGRGSGHPKPVRGVAEQRPEGRGQSFPDRGPQRLCLAYQRTSKKARWPVAEHSDLRGRWGMNAEVREQVRWDLGARTQLCLRISF